MAETTNPLKSLSKLDLGKKVGPLPLGWWVVIAGGLIGFYLYYRSGGEPDEEIAAEDEAFEEDLSIPEGVGEGPGYTYFPPPTPLPSDTTNINTNKQWARYAIEKTIRETNLNNNAITQTVTRYIGGEPLNENQRAILQRVFEIAGSPPNPLPIKSQRPKQDQPKGPKGPPPFPSPSGGTWHRIQRGQTLRGIAARYYERPEQRWRDIFNANRKGRNRPGPRDGFLTSPDGNLNRFIGRWLWIPGPTPKGPNR